MQVIAYEPAMAGTLASVYNATVRGVPHCHPVGAEEFTAALAPAVGEGESHEGRHSERAFVARDRDALLGFVHAAVLRPRQQPGEDEGVIRCLCYPRGRRAAGQCLLEQAQDYLRRQGLKVARAFESADRYDFYYYPPVHLSDRLDHVRALLQFNGYEQSQGEVVLDWPDYDPPEPVPSQVNADISVEWEDGRGDRPNVRVKASREEKQVGSCYCVSEGESSRAPEAQDWLFVLGLGVDDSLQGRGLGRYLLQRALKEARAKGYRHAAISTDWRNYRALLFYSNYGFRVADWTYAFRREMRQEAGPDVR